MEKENLYLVYNKAEWLQNTIFNWSEQEIYNANEKGYIGTRYGVDCYVCKSIPTNINKE